jgi:peptidoglycan/xylan/chitin deacetylase (PgdA/CDA1 family)
MPQPIQVCLSFDFDAMSLWIANFQTDGYCHENPRRLDRDQEVAVIERGIRCIESITGTRPHGYRCPSGSFTQRTLELLQQYGFGYDSSMMADDFTPYYCRVGDQSPPDAPYVFGKSIDLVEIPFSWNLDDFPFFEYTASRRGISPGLADPQRVLSVWWGEFEFLRRKLGTGVYTLTMHPQVIGRGHRMLMLEELIDRIAAVDGVEFKTLGEVATAWRQRNPLTV